MMRKLLSRLFTSEADRRRADRLRALELALMTAEKGEQTFFIQSRATSLLAYWYTGEIRG